MKTILLVIIVILCSLIGYLYGEEFNKRHLQLQELMRIIIDLQNEILFLHTPIPEGLLKVSNKTDGPIKDFFIKISNKLSNNEVWDIYSAFKESIEEYKENLSLRLVDYNILLDLSKSLGETNIEGQQSIFTLAREKLNSELEISYDESKKNTKIYRTLGLGMGLMLAIFLI